MVNLENPKGKEPASSTAVACSDQKPGLFTLSWAILWAGLNELAV